MNIKTILKKIRLSLYNSDRIVLLDFPITPISLYAEENKHPHQRLSSLLADNKPIYSQILQNTIKYKNVFSAIIEDKLIKNEIDPGWNNNYLPGLDMIMLYSLIAQIRPSKYLEIGSGTSTKVAYKSRRENSLHFEIISIDPSPRKNISKVADKIYSQKVQQINPEIFQTLDKDDILFFDGTHILYPNSDVMWFFLEVLPILKKGVIVHIHDIYWPYDYPEFMLEKYYNEQYVLGVLLLNNPEKYEILSPNYFIYTEKELHGILNPIWSLDALKNVEKHGGSFWFRVKA